MMPTTKYKGFNIPTKLIGTQAADAMVARLKTEQAKASVKAQAKRVAKMASSDEVFESSSQKHASSAGSEQWWVREQVNSSSAFGSSFSSSFF